VWAEWIPFGTIRSAGRTALDVVFANDNCVQLNLSVFGADLTEYDASKLTDTGREFFSLLKID